jgi:metallophosphoesterase (TIGR00282 family)
MTDYAEILFLGDIVGKPGRLIVNEFLNKLRNGDFSHDANLTAINLSPDPDFIAANIENASHGFGITQKNYYELSEMGINAFTSGNHIWDKKDIFKFINEADKLVRPLNYPEGVPGVGSRIFDTGKFKIGIINLLGRVFMNPIDSPWEALKKEAEKIKEITPVIIVDFHAEASAEKISFGYFADEIGVSAVIGTHTHVQTADEKILQNGTAYITDAGFCGASEGIIGMDKESSLKRLITSLPEKFDVAPIGKTELNGIKLLIDTESGHAKSIERFKYETNFSEVI